MKLYLETFGCSSNQSISESLSQIITSIGFELVDSKNSSSAQIYLCNTCTVKYTTEQKILHKIKKYGSDNKFVIVSGCMAKIQQEKIKRANQKSIILQQDSIEILKKSLLFIKKIGSYEVFTEKDSIELNEKIYENINEKNELESYLNHKKIRMNKNIHIVQISKGCIFECYYCIVKKAKGKLYSFSPDEIIRDISSAINEGCNEIWITSQDNSQYGLDFSKNTKYFGFRLPDLLKKIIVIPGNFKIRIGMMNPITVKPIINELLDIFKSEKIYKLLHLPIQSASDSLLLKMNRNHKIILANEIIQSFKSIFPDLTLVTDIIVGYCFETKDDFEKTIKWIQEFKPDKTNISRYSPREYTKAYMFKNLDSRIIDYRNK